MIRRLIILLLIVAVFAQELEMDPLEKQMLYKQNDRSPLIAGLCALTPTMGHLYVGQWKRGLAPSPIFIFTLILSGIAESYGNNDDWDTADKYFDLAITYPPLIFYYLQLQDAIYLAYQHNADLYEEIYGKEYIRPPKKSIIQKLIDKKEAK